MEWTDRTEWADRTAVPSRRGTGEHLDRVKPTELPVPAGAMERPLVRRLADLPPVALDARVAGLGAAAVALVLGQGG